VLIVDDNVDAAESMAMLLRLAGQRCGPPMTARRPGGGRGQPAGDRLLDIGLPGMNGYEVARKLRQQRRTAGAVVVALTGYGQDEDRRQAREAGFDRHLTSRPPRRIWRRC